LLFSSVNGFKNNQPWVDFFCLNMVYLYGQEATKRQFPMQDRDEQSHGSKTDFRFIGFEFS
jgi:hypothetical protein